MGTYYICGRSFIQKWDGESWADLDVSGVTNYPNFVIFGIMGIDADNVWAVGIDSAAFPSANCNPILLYTSNGGTTWTEQSHGIAVNAAYFFSDLWVISSSEIYITGHQFYSSQDYYVWKWDQTSTTLTQIGPIVDNHTKTIYAANSTNIYTTNHINGPTKDYHLWDGVTHNISNDIPSTDMGVCVRGSSDTNIAILGNQNPHQVARGSDAGGWTLDTLKSGFYTNEPTAEFTQPMTVLPNGNIMVAAHDTTSVKREVATYNGVSWSYEALGADSSTHPSPIFAASNNDIGIVYRKASAGFKLTSWFNDGSSWVEHDSIVDNGYYDVRGMWGYSSALSTGTAATLTENVGSIRNVFLKIHGLEPIYWKWHSKGPPTDYSRSILTCLQSPAEFSMGLNLSQGLPDISAMTFKFDDVKDTDTTYYWAKMFAPARWDDNPHARIALAVEADADFITCENTSTMPESGEAYIGNETISYTSKDGPVFGNLLGVERDLYPCIPGIDLGKFYKYPRSGDAGYKMSVGTVPFTLVGRQVALYVVTWNREDEKWNSEDDALLVWTGRVTDQLSYEGEKSTWSLSCESLVKDFDRQIAAEARSVPMGPWINISGDDDKLRAFDVYIRDDSGAIVATTTITPEPYVCDAKYWMQHLSYLFFDGVVDWSYEPEVTISFTYNNDDRCVIQATSDSFKSIKFKFDYTCHIFHALGFDPDESDSISFDLEENDDGDFVGEYVAKNVWYQGYQPVYLHHADSILAVEDPTGLLTDQGDHPLGLDVAVLRVKNVKVEGEQRTLYFRYVTTGGGFDTASSYNNAGYRYLNIQAPDLNEDLHYPRAFFGWKKGDEPINLEQVLMPWPTDNFGDAIGPFDILLKIITSTGIAGHNGDYDVYPVDFGLGMPEELINIQSFQEADERVMGKELAYRWMYPILNKSVRELITAECLLFGMAITWIDGQFKVIETMPPPVDQFETTIDEDVIMREDYQPSFSLSANQVINKYDCYVRFSHISNKFESPITISDADSIASLQQTRAVKIEHKGVRHSQIMATLEGFLNTQLLARFIRFPMPVMTGIPIAPTLINKIYAGDVVKFESNKCPNPFGDGTKDTSAFCLVLSVSWNYQTWIGDASIMLLSAAQSYGASYGASAINDLDAANGGWDAGNYRMTLEQHEFGLTTDPKDGERYTTGDFVKIVERAPSDPLNPQEWGPFEVDKDFEADGDDLLTLKSGTTLTGWSSTTEYLILPADYASATEGQKYSAYVADESYLISSGIYGYLLG